MKGIDLTRRRFGRLLVIWETEPIRLPAGTLRKRYLCRCDCGEVVEVIGVSLLQGDSRSCGCLSAELAAERGRARGPGMPLWSPLTSPALLSVKEREEEWEQWLKDDTPVWVDTE